MNEIIEYLLYNIILESHPDTDGENYYIVTSTFLGQNSVLLF